MYTENVPHSMCVCVNRCETINDMLLFTRKSVLYELYELHTGFRAERVFEIDVIFRMIPYFVLLL